MYKVGCDTVRSSELQSETNVLPTVRAESEQCSAIEGGGDSMVCVGLIVMGLRCSVV